MTQEEYSKLMGYEGLCSMEEYQKANMAYMMAGEIDKAGFCREYKKVASSPLVVLLARKACDLDAVNRQLAGREKEGAIDMLRMAHELREYEMENMAAELDNLAMRRIGRRAAVQAKAKNKYTMTVADMDFIANALKK